MKWAFAHNVKWISTETKVYSRLFNYAGTMDGLAKVSSCHNHACCSEQFHNRLSVIDWKSSNYLYNEYLYQTAAYQQAYTEEHGIEIEDRWIIRLGKEDGQFEPWHFTKKDFPLHFEAFKNALTLSNTIDTIEESMAEIKEKQSVAKKLKKAEDKKIALAEKCKGADKYKGIKKPKCNKGNPCKACVAKYHDVHGFEGATFKATATAATKTATKIKFEITPEVSAILKKFQKGEYPAKVEPVKETKEDGDKPFWVDTNPE